MRLQRRVVSSRCRLASRLLPVSNPTVIAALEAQSQEIRSVGTSVESLASQVPLMKDRQSKTDAAMHNLKDTLVQLKLDSRVAASEPAVRDGSGAASVTDGGASAARARQCLASARFRERLRVLRLRRQPV